VWRVTHLVRAVAVVVVVACRDYLTPEVAAVDSGAVVLNRLMTRPKGVEAAARGGGGDAPGAGTGAGAGAGAGAASPGGDETMEKSGRSRSHRSHRSHRHKKKKSSRHRDRGRDHGSRSSRKRSSRRRHRSSSGSGSGSRSRSPSMSDSGSYSSGSVRGANGNAVLGPTCSWLNVVRRACGCAFCSDGGGSDLECACSPAHQGRAVSPRQLSIASGTNVVRSCGL